MDKPSFIQRWKQGIAMISPLQQLEATQKGHWVMLVGLLCGLVVLAFKLSTYWWGEIILIGALFNQIITMLGIRQKIKMLRQFEVETEITEKEVKKDGL